MRAAVYSKRHDVRAINFQEPPLTDTGVKVVVSYCGLCGASPRRYGGLGGLRPVIPPVVLGHEVNGIIAETGRNVGGIHIGGRVCVDPNWSCGRYTYCQAEIPYMCENNRDVVRGFTEYIYPPQESVYPLPDIPSLKYVTLAEPLSCCLHGMDLLDVYLGDYVLTVGIGTIGSMMVQLYHLAGAAQVVAVESQDEKKGLTEALGAIILLLLNDSIKGILQKRQLHINKVMGCVGLKTTIENVFRYAGKYTTVVLFGLGDPQQPATFNQYSASQKELTIKTNFVDPHTTQRVTNLLAYGVIDCNVIISKILELKEIVKEL